MIENVVAKIKATITETPFENHTFLVGGVMRDQLLGIVHSGDIDIVVEGSADRLATLLWERNICQSPPVIYSRFGTAMVQIEGHNVELASARRESYQSDSRKPSVEFATITEDAQRRDFTVNALLKSVSTGKLMDPLAKAVNDLNAKVLRTPLDPEKTFYDDPLRMLRAVRFKMQLGFEYEQNLKSALKDQAPRLKVISAERIRDELTKMLRLPRAADCLRELLDFELLDQFAPEFRDMVGCEQGQYHHLDVWNHSLLVLRSAGCEDLTLSLAALMHDIGKPRVRQVDAKGQIRFFGHESVGAEIASNILRRLRFSLAMESEVALLVQNHMRLVSAEKLTKSACRRIIRDLGTSLSRFLLLIEADIKGLKPGIKTIDMEAVKEMFASVEAETPAETLMSPLSGSEIMRITGLREGPMVGKLKAKLSEDVIEGGIKLQDKVAATIRLMEHFRNESNEEGVR